MCDRGRPRRAPRSTLGVYLPTAGCHLNNISTSSPVGLRVLRASCNWERQLFVAGSKAQGDSPAALTPWSFLFRGESLLLLLRKTKLCGLGFCAVRTYQWLLPSVNTNLLPHLGVAINTWQTPTIPEVQKATLSRGTCNPFIQSHMLIFWSLCATYTALVCRVSFSVSAQTSLFILLKQSETLWFGDGAQRGIWIILIHGAPQ